MSHGQFTNRREAGRLLAQEILKLGLENPVIMALPRGGVPLGYEVAQALRAPLDILMVRKIGAPGNEEYGIGALVDGASPQIIIDHNAARAAGADDVYIEREVARQLAEIERRRTLYRTGPPIAVKDRVVVVVDDGIATGGTVHVALQALAQSGVRSIILAVAVAPASTLNMLSSKCDQIVCLLTPEPFFAVGAHYSDFSQTDDEEVVRLLSEAQAWSS